MLDIIPTIEHFERTNMEFALGYYHWFWFAQPHPFPGSADQCGAGDVVPTHTSRSPRPSRVCSIPEALADYLAAAHRPDNIRGMCEDYRAAAGIDLVHDRESRAAGCKVQCPMLVLWGAKGRIGAWYDASAIWRQYCAAQVTGAAIDAGHYIAEEAPDATLEHFLRFFA